MRDKRDKKGTTEQEESAAQRSPAHITHPFTSSKATTTRRQDATGSYVFLLSQHAKLQRFVTASGKGLGSWDDGGGRDKDKSIFSSSSPIREESVRDGENG
ncbi:hypothetical protein V494_03297 [Pseudogymnoascus sp. VKM F-4513 (FW-928)]|nr:hypothetical protein V494_03297 [Pseudogymnoascus sp. VKM F-4513 (FW-928)]